MSNFVDFNFYLSSNLTNQFQGQPNIKSIFLTEHIIAVILQENILKLKLKDVGFISFNPATTFRESQIVGQKYQI